MNAKSIDKLNELFQKDCDADRNKRMVMLQNIINSAPESDLKDGLQKILDDLRVELGIVD